MGQLAYLKQVAGKPCHNTAGFMIVIKAERLLFQMGKQILTHL
jgi:hypothetical protein